MEIVKIPLGSLTPYKRNAKKHPEAQIRRIMQSIELYGDNDPIAVWGKKNVIVEGHGRYEALKRLGRTEADCIRLDHLTDKERKEYTLVHNKLTMDTDFDFDILGDDGKRKETVAQVYKTCYSWKGRREWPKAFKGAKRISVGSSNPRTAQAKLEAETKKWGSGSRAVVGIPGHVFNAENVRGKIRYVDAQTGTKYTSRNVFAALGSKASSVSIIRTDNLRISDRARESVTRNTKRRK